MAVSKYVYLLNTMVALRSVLSTRSTNNSQHLFVAGRQLVEFHKLILIRDALKFH